MSNTNNNLQTQTSNALHNAIMELLPYKFKWTEKTVPVVEGIDNDIYSTVDACANACEMWKAIKSLKQGKAIVNSYPPTYDQEPATVTDDDEMSKEKEIGKRMALISLSFNKIYKPTNNNLITSSTLVELNKTILQESTEELDDADNSRPIFDVEPLQKVQNDDDNYNVFDNDQEHSKQPESVNEPYLVEQDEHNIIIDSLDMSYDREQDDHDDTDDLAKERDLLVSLF
uniref:Uncharacterized protein n=1 Tax=Tanacetum cinerariifolium TaxID=118510 RepID=A0A6L2LNI1_TANCI|nr:hypothetical protein [Tanacetum cinerariifolium]